MKIRFPLIFTSVLLIAGVSLSALLLFFYGEDKQEFDIIKINDAARLIAENWDNIDTKYAEFDYSVIDENGLFIAATRPGLSRSISEAIKNGDVIYDIVSSNALLGKLLVHNTAKESSADLKTRLFLCCSGVLLGCFFTIAVYLKYLDIRILTPFYRLQGFSRHIADGNLEVPLLMDRKNIFGAFTESFDIMREELRRAREDERAANESKKELVASLSHDIKTPVSSIKAITELLLLKAEAPGERKKLTQIDEKAEQINTLITNMFDATLEELTKLKVEPRVYASTELAALISSSDYNAVTEIGKCPEMLITMDKNRAAQVIDNVISNSYKYAGTPISVLFDYDAEYFRVHFRDGGDGVSGDELKRIFRKYYRSENSAGKSGTGLGLYISKYFMEQMGGDIWAEKTRDYFEIVMKFKL